MYLLDTNVVSELRKPRPHGAVLAWVNQVPNQHLHLSAVTIGEIQAGIELTRETDPAKATEIEAWLDSVAAEFNVLPVTAADFRTWARLMHHADNRLSEDALIAAGAINRHYTLVTRNTRDFAAWNVPVLNPWLTKT